MAGWVRDFFLSCGVRRISDGDGTEPVLPATEPPRPPGRCRIGVGGPAHNRGNVP